MSHVARLGFDVDARYKARVIGEISTASRIGQPISGINHCRLALERIDGGYTGPNDDRGADLTDLKGHFNGETPSKLDDDIFINRSLESWETGGHCVVSWWKAGIDEQPLLIGYTENRSDQRCAVEIDFSAGDYATRRVSYDDTESADLLLCDDRSRYCDPANDREQEKGPTPFSHIFASSI